MLFLFQRDPESSRFFVVLPEHIKPAQDVQGFPPLPDLSEDEVQFSASDDDAVQRHRQKMIKVALSTNVCRFIRACLLL
jgi:hypothetical protein